MNALERARLLDRMQGLDERDFSDDARWWADVDAGVTALPESPGELEAALAYAFEAGRNSTER
jgi:hypothetical protein